MPPKKKSQAPKLGKAIKNSRENDRQARISAAYAGARYSHPVEETDKNREKAKKIQSITQMGSDFDEMIESAMLADKSFSAEKQNAVVISSTAFFVQDGPTAKQRQLQEQSWNKLTIPRRPAWTTTMTPDELNQNEKEAFLNWRRELAEVEQSEDLLITPFEKNIEVWKQLWRVVERSAVVVQIVDARNPLLFRCPDLEKYIKEVDPAKHNVLLVNKADMLTEDQRRKWSEYFDSCGVEHVFWSADAEWQQLEARARQVKSDEREMDDLVIEQGFMERMATKLSIAEAEPLQGYADRRSPHVRRAQPAAAAPGAASAPAELEEEDEDEDEEEEEGEESDGVDENSADLEDGSEAEDDEDDDSEDEEDAKQPEQPSLRLAASGSPAAAAVPEPRAAAPLSAAAVAPRAAPLEPEPANRGRGGRPKWDILNRQQLLQFLYSFRGDDYEEEYDEEGRLKRYVIGMVGYPNVGKSSTINVLVGDKRVGVSATPGKTKHFQTINIGEEILLCDCPGLVFPTFVATKADMLCNGLMSIDHMRDYRSPVTLIAQRIRRPVLESAYGIVLPPPADYEDPGRPPTAQELLMAISTVRGFVVALGMPNEAQAARIVLRDYTSGRLVYVHPPPGVDGKKFNEHTKALLQRSDNPADDPSSASLPVKKGKRPTQAQRKPTVQTQNEMEDEFFLRQQQGVAHTSGKRGGVYTRTKFLHKPGATKGQRRKAQPV